MNKENSSAVRSAFRIARLQARRAFRFNDYAIYHLGRSGSTVLSDQLKDHPKIHSAGELFWGYYGREFPEEAEKFKYKSRLFTHPIDMKQRVRNSQQYTAIRETYGFEVKPYHIHMNNLTVSKFVSHIEALGIRHHIVLERENLLRKILSSVIASGRGSFKVHASEGRMPYRIRLTPERVQIDSQVGTLLDHLERLERELSAVKDALRDKTVLHLTYESDIANDPKQAYKKVCVFLGINPVDTHIVSQKTTSAPVNELLSNFEEISDYLRGTRFSWMLVA
jgi:hypothetical protein